MKRAYPTVFEEEPAGGEGWVKLVDKTSGDCLGLVDSIKGNGQSMTDRPLQRPQQASVRCLFCGMLWGIDLFGPQNPPDASGALLCILVGFTPGKLDARPRLGQCRFVDV
jgi:hypothetical protein